MVATPFINVSPDGRSGPTIHVVAQGSYVSRPHEGCAAISD